jgi:hypothetical protein
VLVAFLQIPSITLWEILTPIINCNCNSFPFLNYLIGHDQYDGSGGGESMDESFLPILTIVETLLILEHEDIFSIQLLWCQAVVDKFHKPTCAFLYFFKRDSILWTTITEKIQQWNALLSFPQSQHDS